MLTFSKKDLKHANPDKMEIHINQLALFVIFFQKLSKNIVIFLPLVVIDLGSNLSNSFWNICDCVSCSKSDIPFVNHSNAVYKCNRQSVSLYQDRYVIKYFQKEKKHCFCSTMISWCMFLNVIGMYWSPKITTPFMYKQSVHVMIFLPLYPRNKHLYWRLEFSQMSRARCQGR